MIGRTIAHYRIESKLGEGGMGVVYKALDTHLDRPVAVKVLPAEAVANPERKRRFVQEAKAASALNHPNIIHVYDIDMADGVDFIAMEFVPGKTLDQVIGRKGLDLGSGLKYAVQIADALATAHAAGIVHRDLKPGNIMVNESGLVKVLDFGLAKLTERAENEEAAATQTIEAAPRTEEGTIVGTVAFMSPEQAQGKKVDARSDIFALGCVLHEVFTGRRAFQGETKMQTLAAILNQEPQAVSELVEGAPRDLEKIIARCLRKDPERRFQTAADLRVALQELKEESESGKLAAVTGATRRPRISALTAGLVIVLIVGAGVLGWWLRRPEKPKQGPVSIRLTADPGLTTDPAVSPNGTLLAYASDRGEDGNLDLWVKQLPNGEPLRITRHGADDRAPQFSPDGAQIAFQSDRDGGGVYVVPALGGAERLIARLGERPRYSPDGKWIAYEVGRGPVPRKIHMVPAAGGTPRLWRPEFSLSYNAVWSPDSKHLIFVGTKDSEGTDWWVAPLDAGPAVRTGLGRAAGDQGLSGVAVDQWIAEGNQILFSARLSDSTNIWRASIAPGTWQVGGPFTRLTFGNGTEVQPSRAGAGAVVYAAVTVTHDIWSLPMEANQGKVTGEPKPVTQDATPDAWPTLSADGKKLAFLSFRSGNADVWIIDLESGKEGALTATPAYEMTPEISFDGSKVTFAVMENGKVAIYTVAAGGGAPERVCEECGNLWHSSPGGTLVFGVSDRKSLWVLDPTTRQKALFVAGQDHTVTQARFSPDGRWMSFVEALGPSRAREVIVPFRGGQAPDRSEWIAVTDGSTNDLVNWWSPDGNLLYFRSDRDGFFCFWAQRLDPATKQPRGTAIPVYHFHRARRRVSNFGGPTKISAAPGKLVFPIREETGNIWMAKLDGMP